MPQKTEVEKNENTVKTWVWCGIVSVLYGYAKEKRGKNMAFNPQDYGFDAIPTRSDGMGERECYITITHERTGRKRASVYLDKDTAATAKRMFGDTCDVAMRDEDASIVLYAGNGRKLLSGYGGKAFVNISSKLATIEKVLGKFSRHKCTAKVWGNGEAILVTPTKDESTND